MTIVEIKKQYDQEWLLIEVDKYNEDWEPLEGRVIFHSPRGDDLYKEMLKIKGENLQLAIEYGGEYPDDVAVLL
jgi:hypothetical protein